jgi:hypothetical protein
MAGFRSTYGDTVRYVLIAVCACSAIRGVYGIVLNRSATHVHVLPPGTACADATVTATDQPSIPKVLSLVQL